MGIQESTKKTMSIFLVALFVLSTLAVAASAQTYTNTPSCPDGKCISCYNCCYQLNYDTLKWEFKCSPTEPPNIPPIPTQPPTGCTTPGGCTSPSYPIPTPTPYSSTE